MPTSKPSTIAWAILVLAILAPAASGQEPADEASNPVRDFVDGSVDLFKYTMADREDVVVAKRLMRWTNAQRDPFGEGLLVVRLDRGLPIAFSHIYPWDVNLAHENIAVGRDRFSVSDATGRVLWTPRSVAGEFKPVPNTEPPADKPADRLRQMKAILKRTSATMLGWNNNDSDREVLRAMDRPLYRYENLSPDSPHGVIDGGAFAFVLGTDPEVTLLLEAVRDKSGSKWVYSFSRATSGGLEASLDDQVVWRAEKVYVEKDAQSARRSLTIPLPPEVLAVRQKDKP